MSTICYVIDRRENVPVGRSYVISCQCFNCGLTHIALFNKGQEAKRAKGLCPFCEVVAELVYRTTAEACKGLQEMTPLLMIETNTGYVPLKETFDVAQIRPNPIYRLAQDIAHEQLSPSAPAD